MVASFLIGLREGLEAALVVGIINSMLTRMKRTAWKAMLWGGVGSALAVSIVVGFALARIGVNLEGQAEEVFEGVVMILAAGLLTWMLFWMQQQKSTIRAQLEEEIRSSASQRGGWGIFSIAFFAVLREGIETVLFFTAAALTTASRQVLLGGFLGLGAAALAGWGLFASTVRLDVKRFFQVTSILLILFAAGLFAHGIHEFIELGWIAPLVNPVWDVNFLLPEDSLTGSLLKSMFGYNGDPSLSEALAYGGYLLALLLSQRWLSLRTAQAKSV